MKRNLLIALFLIWASSLFALEQPKFSTAGFYELPNTGREVYSMNLAWRFYKGDVVGTPFATGFDDSGWEVISIRMVWSICRLRQVAVRTIRVLPGIESALHWILG